MPPGPPLLCRSVCRESKKSPMAHSWRSFFRRETDEEQENGPAVASESERTTGGVEGDNGHLDADPDSLVEGAAEEDRKSTRLNSSHANISYADFCLQQNNT